jgi:7-cyano-7-deazaguanine synthase in queuosine biosynthesis
MDVVETPIQAIRSAVELFVFSCFVNDAIGTNQITLNTFNQQTKLEDDGKGLVIKHGFTDEQLKMDGRNLVFMAIASTALATDKAMDIVFGKWNADDTSELGSARAIVYQIRCAFARDLLVPIWNPKSKY